MNSIELIKNVIRDFQENSLPEIKDRAVKLPINSKKIITVTGVRRSGKTYSLLSVIKQLAGIGVSSENILYINFEDERLHNCLDKPDLYLQAYRDICRLKSLSGCYLFFDEIQNLLNWEKFLRRVHDGVTKHIYVTGSNAKFLSSEIATALRGRCINFEIFPLGFMEYLDFLGINRTKESSSEIARRSSASIDFLFSGGFPEVIESDLQQKTKILQEYFNVMIYRDMMERYGFREITILKYVLRRVMTTVTQQLSVHKIYNEMRSQGYHISKNVVYDMVSAAVDIYLLLPVKKFDPSLIKRENSAAKYYVVDNGLITSVEHRFSEDKGLLFENLIAMELIKSGNIVYYFKDYYECDFIVEFKNGYIPVQVCYEFINPDTKERELRGLLAACNKLGIHKGVVVTFSEEETIMIDKVEVNIVSFQQFLNIYIS